LSIFIIAVLIYAAIIYFFPQQGREAMPKELTKKGETTKNIIKNLTAPVEAVSMSEEIIQGLTAPE
jgi:hypothetical protein